MRFRTMSRWRSRATRSPRSARPIRSSRAIPTLTSTTAAARRSSPASINCHAHLAATLQRGFNEDFGFPNSAKLPVQPGSLLQGEEATLMTSSARSKRFGPGTTTFVENAGRDRPLRRRAGEDRTALGLRRVDPRQRERARPDVAGRSREERDAAVLGQAARRGHAAHHRFVHRVARQEQGRISVFPAAALAETSSPELLQAVRASPTNTISATRFT